MMRRLLLTILFLPLLSCTPASSGPPPVDIDRLSGVIADLHLVEGLIGEFGVPIQDSMKRVYASNVLADHHYQQEEFDSLMWIIRTEPEWIDALFQKVSDKMATMEAEMNRTPPKLDQAKN